MPDPTQRRLVVVRHAKSAWPDGVPDAQRPLNGRGRRDAPAAGRWLVEHVGRLDLALCSPARRARETWELADAAFDEAPATRVDERIYDATPGGLLAVVHDLPAAASTAVLVGHNPGSEDLVELLSGDRRTMATASIAVLAWSGAWTDAAPGGAKLLAHATPRGRVQR